MTLGSSYPLSGKRVFVAGHRGMAGSAIARRLASEGCDVLTATRQDVDLMDQAATRAWFTREKPDAVFVAAAKVGGILANDSYPADFLYDNLMIEANVIEASHRADVEKLLFLGSSCIYPKFAAQPMNEDELLNRPMNGTRSPRLPGSNWPRRTANNMAVTTFPRCRPTSMVRATISASNPAMSFPR